MPFVVDASVALAWFLPDEQTPLADQALDRLRSTPAIVPATWMSEVVNGFLVAERRGRITQTNTASSLDRLHDLPIRMVRLDAPADWNRPLDLARAHSLTVYDATYLDLAITQRVELATLDDALRSAARRVGIGLLTEL